MIKFFLNKLTQFISRHNSFDIRSINSILILSFIAIALIPVLFLSIALWNNAWENAWREVEEKHKLIAVTLTSPLSIYINDHKSALKLVSHKLSYVPGEKDSDELLRDTIAYLNDFQAVLLVDPNGLIVHQIGKQQVKKAEVKTIAQQTCFQQARQRRSGLSGITLSPSYNTPTILICDPVLNKQDELIGVLIGELAIEPLERLRSQIEFGKLGHSAFVDQFGKVIAHPNKSWMREMKDLSGWPIVKKMMSGKQGVEEFYSPFIGENMVAGFSGDLNTGWGVMVPQPKSEIENQVYDLIRNHLYWGLFGLSCALIAAFVLGRWIILPLNNLSQQTTAAKMSGFTSTIPVASVSAPREIQNLTYIMRDLIESFKNAQQQNHQLNQSLELKVEQATKDLKLANAHLERVALIDELTGLPNRRGLKLKLEMAQDSAISEFKYYSLLLCDMDRFKLVNDNYGHHIGDQVLRIFAEKAPRELRQGDEIGRWGGEEFLCILNNTSAADAIKTAERIRKSINQTISLPNNLSIEMSVSIGVASYPQCGKNLDILLSNADTALYEAKRAGRNRVVASNCEGKGVFTIAGLIHDALSNNYLQAAFQPIVDLQTEEIIAEETLARIVTEDTFLEAYQFIEAANQLQLTHRIDYELISHTIKRMSHHKKNNRKIHQFVNVSVDLLRNTQLTQELVNKLESWKKQNLPVESNIIIEITEREFLGRTRDALRLLNPFLENGYLLALDDFGSGYSSFQYLTDLPISYLKIEGSLVSRALKEPKVRSVLTAIQDTANDLEVITLAEGIENRATFELLKELGIQLGQGYYLGKPEVVNFNVENNNVLSFHSQKNNL